MSNEKVCIRCHKLKCLSDFSIIKNRGTYRARCKECVSEVRKQYRENNKEKLKRQKHESYLRNKETVRKYYKDNKQKIKEYRKIYKERNREKIRKQDRNRNKTVRKRSIKARYERLKNVPEFRLRRALSTEINVALKRNYGSKRGESIFKHLPYTVSELKQHLESQFEYWMSWDNWGRYNPETWDDNDVTTWTWQVDHIVPISCFSYSSMDDINFRKCWALENLRPLSAKKNVLDGANKVRHK